MLKYSIERNLRFRVVRYRQVIVDYSFSFAKRRCIPLLIASPLVIPYFSQYSFSLFSVSASRRMLNLLDLGFSAFGLPAGDIKPLPFLSHLYYIYVTHKCQYFFDFFVRPFFGRTNFDCDNVCHIIHHPLKFDLSAKE